MKRRSRDDFKWRPTASRIGAKQIVVEIEDQIRSGLLRRGSRLPSTRTLALRLGVARNTVVEAYEELAARQLIQSCVGSGTSVIATLKPLERRSIFSGSAYPTERIEVEMPENVDLYVIEPRKS